MAVNILNRRRVTYDTLIAGSHRHCAVFGTYFSGFVFSGEKGKKNPEEAGWKSFSMVRWIFKKISRIAGITYEVRGLENIPTDRAVLYVGNHRSYFDIVMGYMTVPGLTGFIAKKEMIKIPLLNRWMDRMNCLFWIVRILKKV